MQQYIKTTTGNLLKDGYSLKAQLNASIEKDETIDKYRQEFIAKGNSVWMAQKLAEERYTLENKNQ